MSRSPYTDKVILTKKNSGKRTHKVQAFVLHHMAAVWTGERCATYLRDTPSRQASANYYIGYGGDVVLGVDESNRAWTSSSAWADNRAITYELANSKMGHPWSVSDATIQKVIVMLAEQHKRYGLKKASYTGDTKGTIWRHDFFAKTNCPGPYLGGKLSYIADEVNKILGGSLGKPSAPSTSSKKKSSYEVAQEVIDGKWGQNPTRRQKLEKSGYNYIEVQGIVNRILGGQQAKPKPVAKSIDQLAREVIDGKHGTGDARKKALGSQYSAVQARVNEILGGKSSNPKKSAKEVAREIAYGKHSWGNNPQRATKLRNAGYNPAEVQKEVNRLLS